MTFPYPFYAVSVDSPRQGCPCFKVLALEYVAGCASHVIVFADGVGHDGRIAKIDVASEHLRICR